MARLQAQWPPIPTSIKGLAAALFLLWILSIDNAPLHGVVHDYMLVSFDAAVWDLQIWTVITYALFHADFMHLLFNMVVLWLFGGEIAARWSEKKWWSFNAACAVGGGVAVVASQAVVFLAVETTHFAPTLGYSGAVMGVLAAFAWQNWNRKIYLFFIPMKGKVLIPVVVAFDIFRVAVAQEPISIAGHLGGLVTGLLIVSGWWRPRRIKEAYRRRKRRKKREQLRVVDSDSDRYVN